MNKTSSEPTGTLKDAVPHTAHLLEDDPDEGHFLFSI